MKLQKAICTMLAVLLSTIMISGSSLALDPIITVTYPNDANEVVSGTITVTTDVTIDDSEWDSWMVHFHLLLYSSDLSRYLNLGSFDNTQGEDCDHQQNNDYECDGTLDTTNYPNGNSYRIRATLVFVDIDDIADSETDISDNDFTISNTNPPVDNVDPVVRVEYPNGAPPPMLQKLSGTVEVSAFAEDNFGYVNVDFYYHPDGQPTSKIYIGSDDNDQGGYTVNWDTTNIQDGYYVIFIEGTDGNDNSEYDSSDFSFYLDNSVSDGSPEIEVDYPNDPEVVTGTITVKASQPIQNNEQITLVSFMVERKDEMRIHIGDDDTKDANGQFTVSWTPSSDSNGRLHRIYVIAHDAEGEWGDDYSDSYFLVTTT